MFEFFAEHKTHIWFALQDMPYTFEFRFTGVIVMQSFFSIAGLQVDPPYNTLDKAIFVSQLKHKLVVGFLLASLHQYCTVDIVPAKRRLQIGR